MIAYPHGPEIPLSMPITDLDANGFFEITDPAFLGSISGGAAGTVYNGVCPLDAACLGLTDAVCGGFNVACFQFGDGDRINAVCVMDAVC